MQLVVSPFSPRLVSPLGLHGFSLLSLSLSLFRPPPFDFTFLFRVVSPSISIYSSSFLPRDFARVQQAGPDQPVPLRCCTYTRLRVHLSSSLSSLSPLLSFSPFPPSPFPSCHHRNSGWKSLNCTHSHARALYGRAAMTSSLLSLSLSLSPSHSPTR